MVFKHNHRLGELLLLRCWLARSQNMMALCLVRMVSALIYTVHQITHPSLKFGYL